MGSVYSGLLLEQLLHALPFMGAPPCASLMWSSRRERVFLFDIVEFVSALDLSWTHLL